MSARLRLTQCLLAASAMLALIGGSQALASTVHCGDTITSDTTLTADLIGCSGFSALNVTGDVTLDLGGHTVSGDAAEGINAHHGRLTIRNGTVSGFDTGVTIAKGGDAYVTRITAIDNNTGFWVIHAAAVFDRNRAFANRGNGFLVIQSSGEVAFATFTRNRADSNGGLGIRTNNAIDGGKNHAHKNGDPRQCVGIDCRP